MTVSEAQIRTWFKRPGRVIGVRDVEGLDFDNKGPSADELYQCWEQLVNELAPGLAARLLCERTPSGGYHLVWHCETIAGNQKLATRPPTADELVESPKLTHVTLIETRGTGGQFQVAPSPGYELLRGDWTALPSITPAERQIALDCARALSQGDKRTIDTTGRKDGRPGDTYNAERQDEALDLLKEAGWTVAYERGGVLYLCRPGKDRGVSATFGYVAPGVLYVFSSNASPFESLRAYSPFAVYTELKHGGDYSAAAAALRGQQGHTTRSGQRVNTLTGEIVDPNAPPAPPLPADWRQRGTTLAELQHRIFPLERWIIEGIFPEGACLLAAKYKSKKSWIALALGLAVSMDRQALGRLTVSSGRVLYLDLEGKQQRIQKRTRAILGVKAVPWPDNFHVFTKWPQADEGMRELEQWLINHPDTALIIIDVLASFRRPILKHEEIYRYDRDTVDPINELAERYHVGILLVHHFNKGKHDDIMDAITGSTGLPSAVDTMWALARDVNDSNVTILNMRGRDLENDDPLALRWDTYLNMHVIEGPASEVAISTERKAIMTLLSDDEPRMPKEIAAALGRPVATVQQLLRKLLNDGLVDKPVYGKYARIIKADQTDQSGQIDQSDQSDKSFDEGDSDRSPSDSDRSLSTDQSLDVLQEQVNPDSDHSDRSYKGTFYQNGATPQSARRDVADAQYDALRAEQTRRYMDGKRWTKALHEASLIRSAVLRKEWQQKVLAAQQGELS